MLCLRPQLRRKPHRVIKGLATAELSSNPWPTKHLRGSRRQGILYETEVGKALPRVGTRSGLWISFVDSNGPGFCCLDHLIRLTSSEFLVVECKLTDCGEAHTQLSQLYLPVMEFLTKGRVRGVVVCKNLTRESKSPARSLVDGALRGAPFHWSGFGPLLIGHNGW